jgi:hypothetical protein
MSVVLKLTVTVQRPPDLQLHRDWREARRLVSPAPYAVLRRSVSALPNASAAHCTRRGRHKNVSLKRCKRAIDEPASRRAR